MTKLTMKKEWLLAVILVASVNGFASPVDNSDKTLVMQQVKAVKWHSIIDDMAWAYTIETRLDTGRGEVQQRVQRFSPDLPSNAQWQLLEQQYETPSEHALHEYRQTMSALTDEPEEVKSSKIISLETLRYQGTSAEYIEYQFQPSLPMFDQDNERSFSGTLYVNQDNKELAYLTVSLVNPISPSFTVKLMKYELRLDFATDNKSIHVVKVESHKVGKLLFVSEFNEKSTRIISEISAVD
ncbi:hypothetical protein DRW07_03770 [Alteromonas sediminis]|uniref:DUF3108 domain-containing protein n=1 Tax=Alteromonas sediminis TaxID=2259342 RepID=A0A3N5ZB99_9ALTE|nr:hypothetical protein [Alteromonas sediminis]RPJ68534.1 hypothetical protein DRW07_03770 [Alteromonas sediminis]